MARGDTSLLRKTLFWLHLAAGCLAGAVILIMSVTGVLLAYERQLLAWLERGPARDAAMAGQSPLPVGELLAVAGQSEPKLASRGTLTLRSDPSEPAELRAGREGAVYVDRATGQRLAGGPAGARAFFQKVTAWHRWLGTEGPGRETGKALTGASNLVFLILICSGAYLWLPRAWSRPAVRAVVWFRPGAAGRAREFNWHHVFGFWMLVPLFLVVVTAMPMSYQWANGLVYRLAGSSPPAAPARPAEARAPRGPALDAVEVSRLWNVAAQASPGWKSITAKATLAEGEPAVFTVDHGDGGQPQKRATLTLDAATAAVMKVETFDQLPAGRRWRSWARFVHTGEYYGVAGQTLAGLASLAGVMLVYTGVALSLRRFAAWRSRPRQLQRAA